MEEKAISLGASLLPDVMGVPEGNSVVGRGPSGDRLVNM